MTVVAKHLFLPKTAMDDIAPLLRLDDAKLRALADCFASSDSILPSRPGGFVQKVANRLPIGLDAAESIMVVCNFLLSVVDEGNPFQEVLDDLREFVVQHDVSTGKDLVSALDARRSSLEFLLSPKPERSRALKVRYLGEVFPTVDSFRTVCELRPVFEGPSGQETIVGYVPVVLLEVKMSDSDGEESTVHLHLSPQKIKNLEEIIKRTTEKLSIIRQKFGDDILGGNVAE
jgi:hypothetical protein